MSRPVPIVALDVDPHNGVIRRLLCPDREVPLSGGGCEFGQWYGFFSQDKLGGLNVDVTRVELEHDASHAAGVLEASLPYGRYRLTFTDRLAAGELDRAYTIESLEHGRLSDLVIRCCADPRTFPSASIDGRSYTHRRKNRFLQFPVRQAALQSDDLQIEFELTEVVAPPVLGVYTYVRDAMKEGWVVHHRLLTRNGASEEYVLRVRRATFSSQHAFWVHGLRHVLWRAAERHPWIRPTLQVGGNVFLARGARWSMRARLRLVEP